MERFIAVPVSPSYLTEHLRSLQHQHMSPHTGDHSHGMSADGSLTRSPHPASYTQGMSAGTHHMMPRSRSPDSMVTIPPSGCTSLVSAQVCLCHCLMVSEMSIAQVHYPSLPDCKLPPPTSERLSPIGANSRATSKLSLDNIMDGETKF